MNSLRIYHIGNNQKTNADLIRKLKEVELEAMRLRRINVEINMLIEGMRSEINGLRDEQKESQITITLLKDKVEELEMESSMLKILIQIYVRTLHTPSLD